MSSTTGPGIGKLLVAPGGSAGGGSRGRFGQGAGLEGAEAVQIFERIGDADRLAAHRAAAAFHVGAAQPAELVGAQPPIIRLQRVAAAAQPGARRLVEQGGDVAGEDIAGLLAVVRLLPAVGAGDRRGGVAGAQVGEADPVLRGLADQRIEIARRIAVDGGVDDWRVRRPVRERSKTLVARPRMKSAQNTTATQRSPPFTLRPEPLVPERDAVRVQPGLRRRRAAADRAAAGSRPRAGGRAGAATGVSLVAGQIAPGLVEAGGADRGAGGPECSASRRLTKASNSQG